MPAPEAATDPFRLAEAAAAQLLRRTGTAPEVALVLGSGWLPAADAFGQPEAEVQMAELPGFVAPTVAGHSGALRLVRAGHRPVVVMLGRSHLYEGRSPAEVVHAVRTAVIAGARTVVLTNAAGGLDPGFRPGQPVLVRDHINLTGASPLTGNAPPAPYGPQFVDLTHLYTPSLREVARSLDPSLAEGVYAALRGPHYETPAEIAMLRLAGANLVGMSTALEAIAARHLGASVLGLSLVTNLAAGISPEPLSHSEVLAAAAEAMPRLGRLLSDLVPALP